MNMIPTPRIRPSLAIALLLGLGLAALAFLGWQRSQAQSAQPPLDPYPGVYGEAQVNVSSLNLRSGPHVSYTAVAYLMEGEAVRLIGRNRAATWAQVELYNGYRGWVNARYLRTTVNIAALPVADVALLGITAFVTNAPIAVYAGPDGLYQQVGTARPGDVLALNGRNDAATWVHVYLPDGRAGWVAADSPFLPSATLNDLPIITPFLDAPPPELAAFYLVYTGPGFLYEPVDSVVEGQTLGIRGRTADARWVLVRLANGREGWIAAEIIQVTVPLDNVPIIEGIAPPQVVGWQPSVASPSAATGAPALAATSTATAAPAATETAEPTATADAGGKPTGGKPGAPGGTAEATEEPTGTVEATATVEATLTGAATITPPATPTPAATSTATPAATEEAPPTAAPTLDAGAPTPAIPVVFVYATPSDENAPILRVVPGQSVVLVGRSADSEWVQIWLPGNQTGWIRASAIQIEIDLAALPIVEP